MSDDTMQIEIKGQQELLHKIGLLSKNLDSTALLDEAAASMLSRIRDRFLRMVDSVDQPWVPSEASFKRSQTGRGGGTLFDTGRLFHSIQLFSVGEDSRAIGTDVPYGKFHNFGTVTLPKREFLAFGQGDVEMIQEIVLRRIVESLNG